MWTEYAAPTGLEFILVLDSTNMPRLTALGDAATIAQPFMAGSLFNQMKKSREGRQKGSFVPEGTLENCDNESQP